MVQIYELLGNKKLLKILNFFLENPSKKITTSEIAKLKIAKATRIKWLNFLVKERLISCEKIGIQNLYSLAPSNPIIKQLKILKNIVFLENVLNKDIKAQIYIYGSVARGENTEKSDIDILVITRNKKETLVDMNKLIKESDKKFNLIIITPREWAQMSVKDKAFYERVNKDMIKIR